MCSDQNHATRVHLCCWSYVCSLRTKSDLLCSTAKPSGASSDLKSSRNKSAACDVLQDKSFLFMRNLAAGRSAAEGIKNWSQGRAVPALVARLQNAQPPQHVLVHVLYCLSNFASTGQSVCPSVPCPKFCILLLRTCCDCQSKMAATGQLILILIHAMYGSRFLRSSGILLRRKCLGYKEQRQHRVQLVKSGKLVGLA